MDNSMIYILTLTHSPISHTIVITWKNYYARRKHVKLRVFTNHNMTSRNPFKWDEIHVTTNITMTLMAPFFQWWKPIMKPNPTWWKKRDNVVSSVCVTHKFREYTRVSWKYKKIWNSWCSWALIIEEYKSGRGGRN